MVEGVKMVKLVSIKNDDGYYELHFDGSLTEDEAATHIAEVYKAATGDDSVFSSANQIYDGHHVCIYLKYK